MPLNDRGAFFSRALEDGRVIDVIPLTFGRARIGVSKDIEAQTYIDGW